jgi:hypothetical protein
MRSQIGGCVENSVVITPSRLGFLKGSAMNICAVALDARATGGA